MRAGGHPSGTAVAGSLVRPTREHRAGRPQTLAQEAEPAGPLPSWPCSGWGLPSRPGHPGRWWSLTPPFHPYLPGRPGPDHGRRSVFCGTVPRVTPGRCYRPPCPAEPGPSSPRVARRGRPAGSLATARIFSCVTRVGANGRRAPRGLPGERAGSCTVPRRSAGPGALAVTGEGLAAAALRGGGSCRWRPWAARGRARRAVGTCRPPPVPGRTRAAQPVWRSHPA